MQSEDPALLMGGAETQDDMRTREWRELPDPPSADTNTTTDSADALGTTDLLDPSIDGADPAARNLIDREAQALAEDEQARSDAPAEVAAIHEIVQPNDQPSS